MYKLRLLTKKNSLYALGAIGYTAFLALIIKQTGIITINEAEKYISAAHKVLDGDFREVISDYQFYFSYISFATIFLFIGGVKTTVIAQAALSFTASVCIKKTLDLLQPNGFISFCAMFIFLFCYPVQTWVVTLFSDSFFISLTAIILYFTIKPKSKPETVLWLFLNIILVFARPPGVFLALAFVMFEIYKKGIFNTARVYIIFTSLFLVLIISIFFIPSESKGYIIPVAAGRVIVDSTEYTIPGFTPKTKSKLADAYQYLLQKKGAGHLMTLYAKKSISFLTLTRSYYSSGHNRIVKMFYLLYPFFIVGLIYLWKSDKKDIVLLLCICIFSLMNLVALTYNEWHYRFTAPIFPFLIIGSAFALAQVYQKK
jgi:hypothetical protein